MAGSGDTEDRVEGRGGEEERAREGGRGRENRNGDFASVCAV